MEIAHHANEILRWINTNRVVKYAAFSMGLFLGTSVLAQVLGSEPLSQKLYLLAATPDIDARYPVTLYRPESGKLKIVREVLSEDEGVRTVQACGNAVFLVRPPGASVDHVTVLHIDEPQRIDDIPIDSNYAYFGSEVVLGRPPTCAEMIIMVMDKQYVPLEVSGDANAAARLTLTAWDDYKNLSRDGDLGGPTTDRPIFAKAEGQNLVTNYGFANHPIAISSIPPSVSQAVVGTSLGRFQVLSSSQRYLILRVDYAAAEWTSGKAAKDQEIFVEDRSRNTWKTIEVDGNTSRSKLFGSWLASIVSNFDPFKPSPGRDNERGTGGVGRGNSARLPNVRELYTNGVGRASVLPGILILQNVEDGRRIRIETGQEDSEILTVRGNFVLYRVNDTIYQATITGDKLQVASILAKGEDVPEIHWVFWSNSSNYLRGPLG